MSQTTAKSARKTGNRVFIRLLPILTVAVFLIIWQIIVDAGVVNSTKLASPLEVWNGFIYKLGNTGPDGSTLGTNILSSLQVAMTGLLIAIVVGVPLGLFMGWYSMFDRFVHPIFEIIRPIPPVAWIPLMIIWMGLGTSAKAMIIFLAAFIPCVINSFTGIRLTNRVYINVSKTFGASNFYTFIHVGIPSAVPMVFAGIRLALGSSWGTLVAAELLAASSGLGYMINMARNFARIDIVILGMIIIGLLGYIFTSLFGVIERKLVKGRTVL
ncbi:MAG: ABC transporter permease [Clostridia bacterium]|nr:ABC transporter permease [Clostridia bacterium]